MKPQTIPINNPKGKLITANIYYEDGFLLFGCTLAISCGHAIVLLLSFISSFIKRCQSIYSGYYNLQDSKTKLPMSKLLSMCLVL